MSLSKSSETMLPLWSGGREWMPFADDMEVDAKVQQEMIKTGLCHTQKILRQRQQ